MKKITLGLLVGLAALSLHPAEGKSSWQAEWEKTVQAAKKEGQLTIYGVNGYDEVFKAFGKRFPEIRVSFVGGLGSQHGRGSPK